IAAPVQAKWQLDVAEREGYATAYADSFEHPSCLIETAITTLRRARVVHDRLIVRREHRCSDDVTFNLGARDRLYGGFRHRADVQALSHWRGFASRQGGVRHLRSVRRDGD